jgi:hypothetical protein
MIGNLTEISGQKIFDDLKKSNKIKINNKIIESLELDIINLKKERDAVNSELLKILLEIDKFYFIISVNLTYQKIYYISLKNEINTKINNINNNINNLLLEVELIETIKKIDLI